tara:strand:+ start:1016 stop:2494 length:1479 start_codon:yes stop_codon:yes gene_type:complete
MKQKLATFFDCESDAGSAMRATCLSISYITCDLNDNFKILEDLSGTINSKFKNSRPFETDAMLAHNIPIKDISNQKLSNGELVDEWEKAFKKLSDKGTIFCGFNSFNYDNILLNNSLFINLKFPYITSKQQFDLLPAIRAASVFAIDPKTGERALNYDYNDKGNLSFKLQTMLQANQITTKKAHDSYEDTRATLNLCKRLHEKAPEVFNAALALRRKSDVLPKIKQENIFCWHEAYFKTTIYCGTYLGESLFPGWYYLYDFRKDPEEILKLDTQGLKSALSKSKRWCRTLKSNRAPIIMKKEFALFDKEYKDLGMPEIKKRYNLIKKHREELANKIKLIQEEAYNEKKEFDQTELQPEEKIYSLNVTNEERNLMDQFNLNNNPKERKNIFNRFKRDDVKILAEMKIFDNNEEEEFCKIFSLRDYKRIKKRIRNFILDTSDSPSPFTKIPAQQARIDTLRVIAEKNQDDEKLNQLEELDSYLENMKHNYEKVS